MSKVMSGILTPLPNNDLGLFQNPVGFGTSAFYFSKIEKFLRKFCNDL
jgi:hypothetical protein